MAYIWILIASWLGSASLQYINTAEPGSDALTDPLDSTMHYPPLPYFNDYSYPARAYDSQNDESIHNHGPDHLESQRKRRTAEEANEDEGKRWGPSIENDKNIYLQTEESSNPFFAEAPSREDNSTDNNILSAAEKRSFSPWGGKRDRPVAENMWSWRRTANIREPSMPKRVRFSPWGGKRSGQMIFKPGNKGSKIILSASVPELTRIVSNFSPNNRRLDIAGFQFIPTLDKRHPIKILALSTKIEDRTQREALPFNNFLEKPKRYNPGHPYLGVSLKKAGRSKAFSPWGGKRAAPIIGPIWTPTSEYLKDSALEAIVLVRNNQDEDELKNL